MAKTKREITNQAKMQLAGRPIVTGDSSKKFKEHLKSTYGIERKDFFDKLENEGTTLAEKIEARVMAIDKWQHFISPIIDYYNMTHAKGITLQEDLMMLEADLIEYRQEHSKDPSWSPVTDDSYQKALSRKADLMKTFAKIQIDVAKLRSDADKRGQDVDAITIDEMTFDDTN